MAEKSLLLIYNKYSGTGAIKNHLTEIIDIFNKAGYEITIYSTQHRAHATELVKKLGRNYKLVVCSGGDGTLSEVVDGVMEIEEENRPKIGYIPSGSTNDYANTLEIPSQMERCAEMITKEHFRKVDVGSFQEDYFIYVAAFGAFTEVSWNTPQQEKNLLGHTAYILEGIRQLPNIRPYHMKVYPDEACIEADFIYGMVYNAESVGGIKNLSGQEIDLDDGYLDVMLVKNPETAVDWTVLLADLASKNRKSNFIFHYRIKKIRFESEDEIQWVLDGEYGGAQKSVSVEACTQAVEIAVKGEA